MGRWSFQASDLASGLNLGAVTVADWSHEDRLSDAGDFAATLAWQRSDLDRLAIDSTLPGRSLVAPVRNGVPLGPGMVVWRQDAPSIAGAGLLSYFDDQTYNPSATRTFSGVDQHLILKELVDWVQVNGGNIQVDTTQVTTSGVLRDQTWTPWDSKNVGEALRQKADNLGGYDFDFRIELDEAGNPVRRMRMWTPRRGRVFQADASPIFTVGGNVLSVPAAPADATAMVTEVVALGIEVDSTDRRRQIARSIRADLRAAGYPRLVHVLDLSDVGDPTDVSLVSLQSHADGYAAYYGAEVLGEIVLDVNPDDRSYPWGSWDLGDDCMVVIPAGIDPAWPTGLSALRRVVAHRWSYNADGESLQVVTGRTL